MFSLLSFELPHAPNAQPSTTFDHSAHRLFLLGQWDPAMPSPQNITNTTASNELYHLLPLDKKCAMTSRVFLILMGVDTAGVSSVWPCVGHIFVDGLPRTSSPGIFPPGYSPQIRDVRHPPETSPTQVASKNVRRKMFGGKCPGKTQGECPFPIWPSQIVVIRT